ncbi:MAG: alanine dehydrogenase [Alphaproteobacteria bacterium]|nr:alanine dehydrogenase [Alphaproteobacteria bacterium]
MKVGVPREIKAEEYRVGLTPGAVREYVRAGHEVLVETGAGEGIGCDDNAYRTAGARVGGSAAEVYAEAEMIVKVKEPQPEEWRRLREGQILFAFLHLAPDRAQTEGLLASGCTAIAYETVTGPAGGLPLLTPMSEVAGRLSVEAAGAALKRHTGGPGLLLGGVPGVPAARVTVLGGGIVGSQAARMAVGLGADVTIIDRSMPRLRALDDMFGGRVRTRMSTIDDIEGEIDAADVVIGAVLVPGAEAPRLITRDMLGRMKRKAVLVDVSIDQGGCFETSHPTTHHDPTFEVDGVIHYCVTNMPGAVPVTSSAALNNATLPYGLALAARGLEALGDDPGLMAGLNVHRGKLTNRQVAESQQATWTDPSALLSARLP